MSESNQPQPTDAELAILNVLWSRGPSTVREVHETLGRQTGYTTVLKLLQIMTDKGLVVRDESRRSHVYIARYKQEQTQRRLVKDLMEKAFSGAADKLILQAISAKKITSEEIAEIRNLLDDVERKRT